MIFGPVLRWEATRLVRSPGHFWLRLFLVCSLAGAVGVCGLVEFKGQSVTFGSLARFGWRSAFALAVVQIAAVYALTPMAFLRSLAFDDAQGARDLLRASTLGDARILLETYTYGVAGSCLTLLAATPLFLGAPILGGVDPTLLAKTTANGVVAVLFSAAISVCCWAYFRSARLAAAASYASITLCVAGGAFVSLADVGGLLGSLAALSPATAFGNYWLRSEASGRDWIMTLLAPLLPTVGFLFLAHFAVRREVHLTARRSRRATRSVSNLDPIGWRAAQFHGLFGSNCLELICHVLAWTALSAYARFAWSDDAFGFVATYACFLYVAIVAAVAGLAPVQLDRSAGVHRDLAVTPLDVAYVLHATADECWRYVVRASSIFVYLELLLSLHEAPKHTLLLDLVWLFALRVGGYYGCYFTVRGVFWTTFANGVSRSSMWSGALASIVGVLPVLFVGGFGAYGFVVAGTGLGTIVAAFNPMTIFAYIGLPALANSLQAQIDRVGELFERTRTFGQGGVRVAREEEFRRWLETRQPSGFGQPPSV